MPKTNPGQPRVSAGLGHLGKPTFLREYGKRMNQSRFDIIDAFARANKEKLKEKITKNLFWKMLMDFKVEE